MHFWSVAIAPPSKTFKYNAFLQNQKFSWPQPAEPKMHVYKWKTTSRENSSICLIFFIKNYKNSMTCPKSLRFPLYLTNHICNFYKKVTTFDQKWHNMLQAVTFSTLFDQAWMQLPTFMKMWQLFIKNVTNPSKSLRFPSFLTKPNWRLLIVHPTQARTHAKTSNGHGGSRGGNRLVLITNY